MSALGQKQTYALQQAMSALPPIATAKADMVCITPRRATKKRDEFAVSPCEDHDLCGEPYSNLG